MLVEPGAFNVLPYGVEVTASSPPEAGNTYEAFTKAEQRYKAAVLGVLYQEMTGDWQDCNDRADRAATLSLTRRINRDRQNIEVKMLRKIAKRFVDRAYLSGAWVPPSGVPQREWYVHEWSWPAARYQNLFQEMNAWTLAVDSRFTSRARPRPTRRRHHPATRSPRTSSTWPSSSPSRTMMPWVSVSRSER